MSGAPLSLLAAAAAGACFGALYLALVWASARALTGGRPIGLFVALAALRAALVVGALWSAFALGAGAAEIVAALAGFVIVRVAATRQGRAAGGGGLPWK